MLSHGFFLQKETKRTKADRFIVKTGGLKQIGECCFVHFIYSLFPSLPFVKLHAFGWIFLQKKTKETKVSEVGAERCILVKKFIFLHSVRLLK